MPRPHTAPHRFDRTDWLHVGGMAGFIALLTALGWFVMIAIVDPGNYRLGTAGAFGTGLGLTAYLLGMRHAFDADHIAAIDNTTRKLAADGQRARGVGFWFSLGHSSVVFVLCLFLALGVRTVTGALDDDGSAARQVHGVAGTIISGAFLVALGLLNLVALIGISRVFARMRSENLDEAQLERHLNSRGFLARILGRVLRAVNRPWHMFPVGFVFGLGFDTASEVTLLVLAGGAAAFALPWYAILVLPVLASCPSPNKTCSPSSRSPPPGLAVPAFLPVRMYRTPAACSIPCRATFISTGLITPPCGLPRSTSFYRSMKRDVLSRSSTHHLATVRLSPGGLFPRRSDCVHRWTSDTGSFGLLTHQLCAVGRQSGQVDRGVHIPVQDDAALHADVGALGQGQLGFRRAASGACLGGGEPAVGDDQVGTGLLGLVGEPAADLRPARVGDPPGQAPVADHVRHRQVLDHDHVVVAEVAEQLPQLRAPSIEPGPDLGDGAVDANSALRAQGQHPPGLPFEVGLLVV
jgi:high-affinity nickel permease